MDKFYLSATMACVVFVLGVAGWLLVGLFSYIDKCEEACESEGLYYDYSVMDEELCVCKERNQYILEVSR